jgi:AcrR family transcriptional regulator
MTATGQIVVRPLSATQAATRRRLLEAARALATEGGYDAVGMRQIAERADLSTPTAYQYFASKDHVLVDLLIQLVGETTGALDARPSRARAPVERTVAGLRRAVRGVESAPNLYIAMTRAYISGSPEVAHARATLESSMRSWIDTALGTADVGNRGDVASVLEAVLFANMVGLVTGGCNASDIGDELERAARTVLRD